MMQHLLQQDKERGYHLATLQASAEGCHLYERLGFAPICRFVEYGEKNGTLSQRATSQILQNPERLFSLIIPILLAHSEHEVESTIKWFGHFHPVTLHFPIALIIMTAVAEGFFHWRPSPFYSHAATFMLTAAACTALPTALFGLAYSYGVDYSYPMSELLFWHRFLGLSVAGLATLTAIAKQRASKRIYCSLLTLLVILVTITGYLGGEMTFGLNHFFSSL